jgi:hypothetical protein
MEQKMLKAAPVVAIAFVAMISVGGITCCAQVGQGTKGAAAGSVS